MNEYREKFFEYIVKHEPQLLDQNYASIDMQPHIDKEIFGMPDLEECLKHPYIYAFIRNGYVFEIRMNRYLTILVDEWTKVKSDIKVYLREKKLERLDNVE